MAVKSPPKTKRTKRTKREHPRPYRTQRQQHHPLPLVLGVLQRRHLRPLPRLRQPPRPQAQAKANRQDSIVKLIRKYLLAGLLVLVPIGITIWVLHFLITSLDQTILLLPMNWRPTLNGDMIPGMGIIFAFALLFITGAIASNVFGKQIVKFWERLFNRIPVVGGIYKSVKQLTDPVLSENGQAFSKAVLIEFPHPGLHSIAFLTNKVEGELRDKLGEDHVAVYIPTTPNPTGGYMLLVPKANLVPLDMSVDQALKYIISMGVAAPPPTQGELARWAAAPPPFDGSDRN